MAEATVPCPSSPCSSLVTYVCAPLEGVTAGSVWETQDSSLGPWAPLCSRVEVQATVNPWRSGSETLSRTPGSQGGRRYCQLVSSLSELGEEKCHQPSPQRDLLQALVVTGYQSRSQ